MKTKVCIISIIASHYRKLIYQLLDREFDTTFIFGQNKTTVKELDLTLLHNTNKVRNRTIGPMYYQPKTSGMVKECDIIINDLGIFCLTSWLIMILAKFRHQKMITWGHGWYGRENWGKRLLKRMYYTLTDDNLIYGNYAKDLMVENGIPDRKLHVIHNSLDYDKQLMLRNELKPLEIYKHHFKNDNPTICFIGRLTTVKKISQIIEALHILKTDGVNCNLVVIGDGEEMDSLKIQVSQMGLNSSVWFFGACYDEKTNAELIYNADLCVSPGNVGLTAIHAMMFGCPVLTHNDFPWQMPEFEAIKDGCTGTFFNRDDVNSLAHEIKGWLSEKKIQREEVRKACYKEIDENWNPYKQIDIIKSVIHHLENG